MATGCLIIDWTAAAARRQLEQKGRRNSPSISWMKLFPIETGCQGRAP
jgi:hypothetical protein